MRLRTCQWKDIQKTLGERKQKLKVGTRWRPLVGKKYLASEQAVFQLSKTYFYKTLCAKCPIHGVFFVQIPAHIWVTVHHLEVLTISLWPACKPCAPDIQFAPLNWCQRWAAPWTSLGRAVWRPTTGNIFRKPICRAAGHPHRAETNTLCDTARRWGWCKNFHGPCTPWAAWP